MSVWAAVRNTTISLLSVPNTQRCPRGLRSFQRGRSSERQAPLILGTWSLAVCVLNLGAPGFQASEVVWTQGMDFSGEKVSYLLAKALAVRITFLPGTVKHMAFHYRISLMQVPLIGGRIDSNTLPVNRREGLSVTGKNCVRLWRAR